MLNISENRKRNFERDSACETIIDVGVFIMRLVSFIIPNN